MRRGEDGVKNERLTKLCWLFAAVVVFWGLSWLCVATMFPGMAERGQFGDMFGAINSLFSGLAFAGVVFAILLQRSELALQREELASTRKELERSASAQERSEKALSAQLRAVAISAQLSAVQLMIRELVEHMDTDHRVRTDLASAASVTRDQLGKKIEELDQIDLSGRMGPGEQCLRRDYQTLSDLKLELSQLHAALKEMINAAEDSTK